MFAVINNGQVVSFIIDETQKEFLLENHPEYTFAEFEWDFESEEHKSSPLMFHELRVNDDGTVTLLRD